MTLALAAATLVAVAGVVVLARRARALQVELAAMRSEQARAEDVQREMQVELSAVRLALDEVPQGVVICDHDGSPLLRNRAADVYTGARHAEALVEQAIDDALRAALGGESVRNSLDLFGPPRRLLAISATPLEVGAVAVVDDVSERRRVDAMRRDFVSNISHELKTPVGALGVLAEAIVDAEDGDTIRRLAERMTGEALRVGRIIDDLLALTRIESDEATPRETVRLTDVVNEAVHRVLPLADSRGITIDTTGVGSRHVLMGDPRQLVSAVANLLENACKYSEPGLGVEVRTRSDGAWVELDVEDHGIGIPSSDVDRIFERFYRVDRARSRETGGTGLGLAIVRHVATNHRGEVTVRSTEGEGSTFRLRLPVGIAAEGEAS